LASGILENGIGNMMRERISNPSQKICSSGRESAPFSGKGSQSRLTSAAAGIISTALPRSARH
jgi:hypothetical protein